MRLTNKTIRSDYYHRWISPTCLVFSYSRKFFIVRYIVVFDIHSLLSEKPILSSLLRNHYRLVGESIEFLYSRFYPINTKKMFFLEIILSLHILRGRFFHCWFSCIIRRFVCLWNKFVYWTLHSSDNESKGQSWNLNIFLYKI